MGAGFLEELAFKSDQDGNCVGGQITGLRNTVSKFMEVRVHGILDTILKSLEFMDDSW